MFKTTLTPNDINAVKLSTGGGTKYGDMIQIFFARREAISEVMDYYFRNLYTNKKNREIDTAFRKLVGRWERYKSMAEVQNGKKFTKLKESTYPEILKTCKETWESKKEFKEDIEKNPTVVAEKIKNFTIPILNGNRTKNLGADCITIILPKQHCTKAQKVNYQEQLMDTVREAKRWEDWNQKQVKRQEEDQRQKSEQYARMHKNDVPDSNKSFKLHDDGVQIIYGNTRSFSSSYRKKQYLSNNAYTEDADLLLISESGFVEGAQPYINGYEQCGNVAKPIEKTNTNYYTGGVAAWKKQGTGPKILYRDLFNQIKGLQALKLVMEAKLTILCFYRSPNQTKEEIEETIESFKKIPEDTIIVGDLNIPETEWTTNEISRKTGCKSRKAKEDLVLQLTIENDRRQRVDFVTNKFNDNILDVIIAPNDRKISNLKEVSSPNRGEDPGTDHKWFGFKIEKKTMTEGRQEHTEVKTKVNYEYMNEILGKKEWRFQDHQEEVHNTERCGMCELATEIRKAEHMSTTIVITGKKNRRIPEGVMAEQKKRMELAKEKRHISETHRRRYKDESDLYDKMCKENYVREQRAFENGLKEDRNAIYLPLKNKNRGNIKALKDEDNILQTSPRKVVEVHAKALTKMISKEPRWEFKFEETKKKLECNNANGGKGSKESVAPNSNSSEKTNKQHI